MTSAQDALIKALHEPGFYDHPVDRVEFAETHASWVFLAGEFAYKLKKPLDLGFLDFSTLERRRHFCHEELRLNRRFAPQLYLEVVSIGVAGGRPKLKTEPACDYAVKMKRFPARQQLDRMQEEGRLTPEHLERFATLIAHLHRQAPVAGPAQDFGSPESVIAPIRQNFVQIKPLLPSDMQERLARLERWSLAAGRQLRSCLRHRKQQGFIRECHGDVHLRNMAWFNDAPLLFDCIEFNENLRWIDLVNDIAFLVMDLDDRGEAGLGWRFLNSYLQESGDYQGVRLLNFYKVYRAMVRAKVTCLRLSQDDLSAAERAEDQRLAQSYLALAESYTTARPPLLIMTHGLSGSGKTTFIKRLAPCWGALCIHSDVERKRLHHLQDTASSHSPVGAGLYSKEASTATYRRLQELANLLLAAGFSTIVDATFIRKESRESMRRLAEKQQVPLVILDFPLAMEELEHRVRQRVRQPAQISEATPEILAFQRTHAEPLSRAEQKKAIRVLPDADVAIVAEQLAGLQSRQTVDL